MYKLSKQIVAVGLPVAVVAVSGVAAAYWTSTGNGTGSATTAPASATLTVTQASAPSGMAPGVAPAPITVTVTNGGTSSVRASQVVVRISAVTPAGSGTCTASDYVLAGATMTTGAGDLAPTASTTFSGASLGFANDTGRNQDGCKGAAVSLAYDAS